MIEFHETTSLLGILSNSWRAAVMLPARDSCRILTLELNTSRGEKRCLGGVRREWGVKLK